MKFVNKVTALLLAAAMSVTTVTSAFADTAEAASEADTAESASTGENTAEVTAPEAAGTETSILYVPGTGETIIIGADGESSLPDSGVDLSDTEYTPADLTGYVEWDGKTRIESGTNYYISQPTKLKKNFTVPAGSTFVVCSGAELYVYKDKSFGVKGSMLVEPNSTVSVSGTFTVYNGAGFETYGNYSATKSSTTRIQSEFIIRHGAKAVVSGEMNIYANGMYLNYGQTTLTANSRTKITGEMQTPSDGRLLCKGYLGITISGRATQAGFFSLTGEFVNSGVFILESTVKFYKSKSARFAVSKSSRLIDYRNNTNYSHDNSSDDENEDEELGQTTDVGAKGIDVSYAQGAVDWAKVKAAGIEFAMIRASRGSVGSKAMAKDTTFDYNITEATKNGIKVGVYHYLYATTVAEAKKEAQFFIETISPYKITYPVVLDVEEQSQANLGKTKITSIVKAFLDEVSAAGYYAMLYSNKAWLTDYLNMSKLSDYDVWLAQWNTVPTYTGDFGIWQYSSKGIVSGIDGYVDLNLSYKNYTQIIKQGGYNNLS